MTEHKVMTREEAFRFINGMGTAIMADKPVPHFDISAPHASG